MKVVKFQAIVKMTLAEMKRDTVWEAKSLWAIDRAFCFGLFQISLEQDRFKIIKTNYESGKVHCFNLDLF